MSADQDWLQVVAVPALIASIPGGVATWQWWIGRKDKKAEAARTAGQTADDHRDASYNSERDSLFKSRQSAFDIIEADRDMLRKERDEAKNEAKAERAARIAAQRETDAAWVLVRRWWLRTRDIRAMAQDIDHAYRNCRQIATELLEKQHPPRPLPDTWRDFTIPEAPEDLNS